MEDPIITKQERQSLLSEIRDADMLNGQVTHWQEMASNGPVKALVVGFVRI